MKLKFRVVCGGRWSRKYLCEAVPWYTVNAAKINQTLHLSSKKHMILVENTHLVKYWRFYEKVATRGKSVLWPQKFSWNCLHVSCIQFLNCFNKIQLIKMCNICTFNTYSFVFPLYTLSAHPLLVKKEHLKYNI